MIENIPEPGSTNATDNLQSTYYVVPLLPDVEGTVQNCAYFDMSWHDVGTTLLFHHDGPKTGTVSIIRPSNDLITANVPGVALDRNRKLLAAVAQTRTGDDSLAEAYRARIVSAFNGVQQVDIQAVPNAERSLLLVFTAFQNGLANLRSTVDPIIKPDPSPAPPGPPPLPQHAEEEPTAG